MSLSNGVSSTMKIKHTYDIITTEGSTSDIISVVMMAYEIEKDNQIADLANELKGETELDTCRNVWQYLCTNIRYIADVGTQEIKSPARLVHDGFGDCKSYSVFTACILRYLGIKHFFRFASYSNVKEATHVYVVAKIDNNDIPIDAVAYVQAMRPFGTEIKYTYRVDMNNRTTRIAYLAGIENYKIGATDFDVQAFLNSGRFDVWLDDESENSLTLAKGYLLSEWAKEWANYSVATSNTEALEALNRLQYVGAMIRAYNENRNDNDALLQVGKAIAEIIDNRDFDSTEMNPDNRDFFSDDQNERIIEYSQFQNLNANNSFVEFWNENIVEANNQYTDDDGEIMGIGSVQELRTNLMKTGGYYLYTYIPDADASKYNATVYRKRLIQKRILELNKDILTTSKKMSAGELDNLIYSGCVSTWGANPGNAIVALKQGINGARIGEPITAATIILICKVIIAVITVIVAVVKAINALKAVSPETVEGGAVNPDDLFAPGNGNGTGNNKPGSNTGLTEAGTSWLLPLMLVGGFIVSKLKR